jgi:hypothetical protein
MRRIAPVIALVAALIAPAFANKGDFAGVASLYTEDATAMAQQVSDPKLTTLDVKPHSGPPRPARSGPSTSRPRVRRRRRSPANMSLCGRRSEATGSSRPISGTTASRDCNPPSPPYPQKWSGDGALLPLFRLVGALCVAALWRVKSLLRHCSDRPKLERACPGSADPCYSKISLRFSSNSALSISPLANRSFKISRAREAVSYGSGPSSRLALRKPQQHMVKSSIRLGPTGPTSGHAPTRPACSPKCGLAL